MANEKEKRKKEPRKAHKLFKPVSLFGYVPDWDVVDRALFTDKERDVKRQQLQPGEPPRR